MERKFKRFKRFGVLIGVPILATSIVVSLLYYISVWYSSNKILVINSENMSGYAILIMAIFLSSAVNIGLTIYYSRSLKKVERLVIENCNLSELLLQFGMKSNNDIMNAIKGGDKVD